METKICNKCGKELPLNEQNFHVRKDSKDGFRNDCIICHKNQHKEYRKNNSEKLSEQYKKYYQENTKKVQDKNNKYRENNVEKIKKHKQKYYEENKEIITIKKKIYYEKTKEDALKQKRLYYKEKCVGNPSYKERIRRYIRNNKDKINTSHQIRRAAKKLLPHTLTSEQWKEIKKEFNNKCAYCGEDKKLTQEHFIPLSKGGEFTKNNIIPCCSKCNSSKRDKDFFEWYPDYEHYSKEREQFILKYLEYKEDKQQLKLI